MSSTLRRLFRYAKGETDALENFTTEALAAAIGVEPSPFLPETAEFPERTPRSFRNLQRSARTGSTYPTRAARIRTGATQARAERPSSLPLVNIRERIVLSRSRGLR